MIKKFLLASFIVLTSIPITFGQQRKPNIVFILADDLGYADIGAYGQKIIKTPHLDTLAKQGMKFTAFYTGTSVCAPSRSSLLTGQHTGHTYIRGNKELEPEGQEPLVDSVITFAMQLQNAGYATGAFGKWGLGMVGTTGDPNKKGFDQFYGYNCQRQAHTYYPSHLWSNNEKIEFKDRNVYAADLIQEKTLAFIDEHKNEPFFLFVPTVLPHAELAGPQDSLYQRYENQFDETPYKHNHYANVDKPRAMYASMVTRLDMHVGQIIAKLDSLGLAENTIVMFASDNGAHKEGGADPDFFQSSGEFKGIKRSLYEGGLRTPFIAYWPTQIKANQVVHTPAAFWDIMPTVLELAQTPNDAYTDGVSIVPTLLGKGKQKKQDYYYWEFHEEGGRQAVRQGDWKLILQKVKSPKESYVELFNLKKDPSEKNNIADQNPKKVAQLKELIKQAHHESELFPLVTATN